MAPVTAPLTFEIEISLTGTFSPGCAAWGGSRFEPPINPPEPASMEDMDITDIGIVRLAPAPERERVSHPRGIWKTTSILDGVDRQSEAFRRIVQNILALQEDAATEALLAEIEEAA
jgi:hypothetical protein